MRVLAIDPKQYFNQILLKGFKQEGFLVDRAGSIPKALWLMKTTPYDIVILNYVSFENLIKVSKEVVEESPSAFFMALLPGVSLEEKINLFESGIDEVVAYSCSFREMIIKMRSLLRREKNLVVGQKFLEIDNLKIDPERFVVQRGEVEIYLRRKEFDLLHFFFRNQGKVISKMSILEGVWDTNADVLTNTLEVHILNLRKKIDDSIPWDRRLIHTIYGRGYLFGLRPSVTPATAFLSTN